MRVILSLVVLLIALSNSTTGAGATPQPNTTAGTFVWSGGQNHWGYNHRYNRLGNFVKPYTCVGRGTTCRAKVVQTAASGIGPDTAEETSYWWQVQAAGIGFANASVNFPIEGRKGADINKTQLVRIPVNGATKAALRDRKQYQVLLNGFDLLSKGDSAKLVKLHIGTSDVRYDAKREEIAFRAHALVNLNCSSNECARSIHKISYALRVQTVVLAGDAQFAVTAGNFGRTYSWQDESKALAGPCGVLYDPEFTTPGEELSLDPIQAALTGNTTTSTAFLAFRSLSFSLNAERHMIEFNTAILPGSYDGQRYTFSLDLLLKNWAKDMQSKLAPFSQCSFAEPGTAKLGANVALVQLQAPAGVTHNSMKCAINWPGFNLKPSDPKSTCIRRRAFTLTQ